MSPTAVAFCATAIGALLAALVGVTIGRWWARRDWATHRDYTRVVQEDLTITKRDLAVAEQAITDVRGQLAEAECERDHLAIEAARFPQRLQAAYDAGRSGAQRVGDHQLVVGDWPDMPTGGVPVSRERWVALREAQENWETN